MPYKNVYTLKLSYESKRFIIKGYHNNISCPAMAILRSNNALNSLLGLLPYDCGYFFINKINKLIEIIDLFKNAEYKNISFVISDEVLNLKFCFDHKIKIKYVFNEDLKCLERISPENCEFVDKDFIKIENTFYHLKNPIDFDFTREYIEDINILIFVKEKIPHLKDAAICDVQISNKKLLLIKVNSNSKERIEIIYKWALPLENFFYFDKFILVNKKIYEMDSLSTLKILFKNQIAKKVFQNQEIPYFIQHIFPFIKGFFINDYSNFEKIKIHSDNLKACLKVYVDTSGIVGKVYAKYSLNLNGLIIDLDKLSELIKNNFKYICIDEFNWLIHDKASNLIKKYFRFLKPYVLYEKEIIYQGSERLYNLSSNIIFDNIKISQYKDKTELGINHYKFLLKYGMSGGVIANEVDNYEIIRRFLSSLFAAKNHAKVLIIADKSECSMLSQKYGNYTPIFIDSSDAYDKHMSTLNGVFVMSWNLINHCINIFTPKWDIIIFISIEELIQVYPEIFNTVINFEPSIFLNFTTIDQNETLIKSEEEKISKVLKYYADESMKNYLYRNVNEVLSLPPPYLHEGLDYSYEHELDEALNAENFINEISDDSYFRFKNQINKGVFPKTEVSNVFKYICEKINKIEWTNADDILLDMLNIWFYYRDFFSELDEYLLSWCFDFININKPNFSMTEYIKLIIDTNVKKIPLMFNDILLDELAQNDEAVVDFKSVQILSSYDILKSKFFQNENQDLIISTINDIMALINKYFLRKYNKNILNMHSPNKEYIRVKVYKNAIYYINPQEYDFYYRPYTTYFPLTCFITNIIKYTEKIMRKNNGNYKAFSNVNLDNEYKNLIDEYFNRKYLKPVLKELPTSNIARADVNIDMEKVYFLKRESSEILDILSTIKDENNSSNDTYIEDETANIEDMDLFEKFSSKMSSLENEVLKYIIKCKEPCEIKILTDHFKGYFINTILDGINSLSKEIFGNLLLYEDMEKVFIEEELKDMFCNF